MVAAFAVALGCGDDDRRPSGVTRGDVCAELTPASCAFRVRCGVFEGSMSECLASESDCCVGEDCDIAVDVAATDLATCADVVEASECGTTTLPAECGGLVDPPPADMGMDPEDGGVGGPVPLYGYCNEDADCAEGLCVTVVYGSPQRLCSLVCEGPDDVSTCGSGGHCIRVRVDEAGTVRDGQPRCLESCNGGASCPLPPSGEYGIAGIGMICTETATGNDVCVPE